MNKAMGYALTSHNEFVGEHFSGSVCPEPAERNLSKDKD